MSTAVSRKQVLGFRVRAQQLGRADGSTADTRLLDMGVQDTGPDGGLWALALRGVDVTALAPDALANAWTLRGAPHLYRREDLESVAAAVAPYDEADAAKRVFDASRPLKAAGIPVLDALDRVATTMREIVSEPTVKGDVSGRLTEALPAPYLRFCKPCDATHIYEMPFRIGALRGGLELRPGTSPPVLERAPGLTPVTGAGREYDARHDVIRNYLALLGPATPKQVAGYLDAPVKEVKAHWPADVVEVSVDGETRSILAEDEEALRDGLSAPGGTHLLGPYDLFLQSKDRPLLVDDPARAKALWPVIGRPGAVLHDGEVAGMWRPRKSGAKVGVAVELWTDSPALRRAVEAQAERLAVFRCLQLGGVAFGT